MGILGLQLESRDLSLLKEFYVNRLGLTLLEETSALLSLQVGTTKMMFTKSGRDEEPTYRFAFGVPLEKFSETVTWLSQRMSLLTHQGHTVINLPSRNTQAVFTSDPAGNLAVFAAQSSGNSERFSGLSHIWMPVDDVAQIAGYLQQQLEVETEPVHLDDQTSVLKSDDNCTFVIAQRGAPSFPGDLVAEVHPITMSVTGEIISETKVLEYPYYIHRINAQSGTNSL